MKIKLFNASIIILMLLFISTPDYFAKRDSKRGGNKIAKTNGSPSYARFNINKISTWIKNDGETDVNQNGNSGFVYPQGSNKACVFQSGFLWGGKVNGEIRVGGSTYNQGQLGGAILPDGSREDENLPHVRIYRVRRDYKTGNLTREALDEGLTEAQVFEQYDKDWNEWPWQFGAPYEDVDGNGSYDPTIDIPGEAGSDQTIWFVANDLDPVTAQNFYGSPPMGLEMQATIFGYSRIGPLGSMLFRRYMLINKSSDEFTDFYVCMWSDPDVGDATDDYVGSDTTLSLGYCYNGNANDATYEDTPPATGFDFFQGPVVDGEATDTAKFLRRKLPGKRNLGMSAFFFFINSDPVYSDPALGEYAEGTLEMYNLFQGKIGTTGQFFTDPTTGLPTVFTLYGDHTDPNETGWLDGQLHPPGDRRLGMVAGPFTMAAGDTQEVVVGQLAAGATPGINNIKAIEILKQYDNVAQEIYNNDFVVPSPPELPKVTATALDQQIVLTWDDFETVEKSEGHNNQGYVFQGYNVYQLPTANSLISEATKLATYDVIDGIKTIIVNDIDPNTGVEVSVVSQTGTDSGIQRFFNVTKDAILNAPLVNGKRYFFAVTAFAYNPDLLAVPQVLENDLTVITVVPHSENPGVRYGGSFGDEVSIDHTSGNSDGFATYVVVDPTQLTGHSYEISFDTADGNIVWNLTDVTTGEVKIRNSLELTGDDAPIVDGLQIKVSGAPLSYKDFTTIANAAGPIDPPDGASADYNNFPGVGRPTTDVQQSTNSSRWMVYGVRGDEALFSEFLASSTQYTGGFGNNPGIHQIIPDDFEIRFTETGGKGFMNWTTLNVVDVPFEFWNIKDPNDPNDDFQIFPFILDNNENDIFDLNQEDHDGSSADNDPYTDGIYTLIPLDETPGNQGYLDLIAKIEADPTAAGDATLWAFRDEGYGSTPGLMRLALMAWNNGTATDDPATWLAQMPEVGTVFRITLTKPNAPGSDLFSFTAPGVTTDNELAKEDVEKINVFPNPYYGVNTQELNKYQRFVTFNHLPQKATIRIFNLAGQLVSVLEKNTSEQFLRWSLQNSSGLPVASGLYIAYIDMPDLGKTKILKLAIIQEQQILDRF